MRQLFCHLSLPEPLQFSVWVPVTIPAMCLCCHLSFLSTVCIYHGSQNKALKHSRSTVLLGLSLFWLLKQESQLWPAVLAWKIQSPIASTVTLCSPAPYLVVSVWAPCHYQRLAPQGSLKALYLHWFPSVYCLYLFWSFLLCHLKSSPSLRQI